MKVDLLISVEVDEGLVALDARRHNRELERAAASAGRRSKPSPASGTASVTCATCASGYR